MDDPIQKMIDEADIAAGRVPFSSPHPFGSSERWAAFARWSLTGKNDVDPD